VILRDLTISNLLRMIKSLFRTHHLQLQPPASAISPRKQNALASHEKRRNECRVSEN
jgi:hypothetical protein